MAARQLICQSCVLIGAGQPGEKAHTYRFGGNTCMTGDVIGDYSFDAPLKPGDQVIFTDHMPT